MSSKQYNQAIFDGRWADAEKIWNDAMLVAESWVLYYLNGDFTGDGHIWVDKDFPDAPITCVTRPFHLVQWSDYRTPYGDASFKKWTHVYYLDEKDTLCKKRVYCKQKRHNPTKEA